MATPTYDLLDSTTLSSSAASFTISSLDTLAAGYRDLILVTQGTTAGAAFSLRFNGDSTFPNYAVVQMQGNGSTATSSGGTDDQISISYNSPAIIQIFDFAETNKHKTVLTRENSASVAVIARAGRYASTSAITTINMQNMSGFGAGSTIYLYGVSA